MTYTEAKAIMAQLEARAKSASDAMNQYPKGPMGLTPDAVKASPQWRSDRSAYQLAAAALRSFSAQFLKAFAKEYRAERRARIEAMTR